MQLLAIQARRADAQAHTPDDIERAGALALESIEIARRSNRPAEADAIETARSVLIRLPLEILSHGSSVWSLAVLADGRLASGGRGTIKLWPKDGSGEPMVLSHNSSAFSLAVLVDGRLASGGIDGNVKLWPKDGTGEPLVFSHGSSVWSLAVLADGRWPAAAATARSSSGRKAVAASRRCFRMAARSHPWQGWRTGGWLPPTMTARSSSGSLMNRN